MNLFERTGKIALGSRLRLLSSRMTDDATKIYRMYELELSPNWFPVLFILSQDGAKTITEIAEEIGHSQPSVTKIVKEMTSRWWKPGPRGRSKLKNFKPSFH